MASPRDTSVSENDGGALRVVQLLTQSSGGPSDHAVDVARELARRGHDSHVVGPVGALTVLARADGVTWHDLPVADKRAVRGATRVGLRLRALRPDVLHLHDRRAGWLGRLLAPSLPASRVVATLHGVPDGLADLVDGNAVAARRRRRDRLYYLHAERLLAGWSGCEVVVPSQAVARYARDHVGHRGARVHVVPNGVDTDLFRPPDDEARRGAGQAARSGSVRLVWLGSLDPVKRVDLALDAVRRTPRVTLDLLGVGSLEQHVRGRVVDLGLDERVRLLGRVDDPAEISARLAGADAYLLTSAAENCPLSLLQAMACALPVVATAVGGVPEVVRDEVDGLLCRPDDGAALAGALARLRDDSQWRRDAGAAARRRIQSAFTLARCVDGLESVYGVRAGQRAA